MKKTVILIYGGASAEHDVSVLSAANTADHLDADIIPVGITGNGKWYLQDSVTSYITTDREISIVPASGLFYHGNKIHCDVLFPLIHGTFGEDGALQGILSMLPYPAVTSSIESSALGMSKHLSKLLCRSLGIPITPSVLIRKGHEVPVSMLPDFPLFIKPDRCGSSIGVSRAASEDGMRAALDNAFLYDHRVLVEQAVKGFEIQCAWISDADDVTLSYLGEIHTADGMHGYGSKYLHTGTAAHVIPSQISPELKQLIYGYARTILEHLSFPLYGRIDFFLNPEDKSIFFNELNTAPGMTSGSMFPSLWAATGRDFRQLLKDLINSAVQIYNRDSELCRTYKHGEKHGR